MQTVPIEFLRPIPSAVVIPLLFLTFGTSLKSEATAVVLRGRRFYTAHIGDSRLYRVRHGQGELLTQDDSIVQHMVRSGMLSEEQGRAHPQKNHLLAALGIEGDVNPHTVVRPVELMEGDAFLLGTDLVKDPARLVAAYDDAMRLVGSPAALWRRSRRPGSRRGARTPCGSS